MVKSIAVAILLGITSITAVLADDFPKGKTDVEIFLDKASGVYKRKFKNGLVDGTTYESENILEIVPVDGRAAYVRMELKFSNGHEGSIYGVAQYGNNSLILDVPADSDSHCVVEFVWGQDKIISKANYEKTPACGTFHGARGTFDGAEFSVSKRRKISYLGRLKKSRQYKEALDVYGKRPK